MKPEPSDDDLLKPRTVDKTDPGAHLEAAELESAVDLANPPIPREPTDPATIALDPTDPSPPEDTIDAISIGIDQTDPGHPPEPTEDGASILSSSEISSPNSLLPSPNGVAPQASSPPLQPEVMDRLIRAFDRPPQRPQPNYVERPQSDGGNAVAYSTTADPVVPKYPEAHRAQVLVEIAELTRSLPAPKMEAPNTPSEGRDRTTAPPLKVQERRTRNRILAAVAALLIGGVTGAAATLRQSGPAHKPTPPAPSVPGRDVPAPHAVAPAAPALASIREENAHVGPAAAPFTSAMTSAAPSASTLGGPNSARAPAPRTPALRAPPNSKPRLPATAPSTKPSDDTTLDELDRVRVAPAPGRD